MQESPLSLHAAAALSNAAPLAALLARTPKADLDGHDEHGRTALDYAVTHGHAKHIAMLLAAGADPSAPRGDNSTTTAVHLAARNPNINLLRMLLDAGGDINACMRSSGSSYTPLSTALRAGNHAAVELLMARGAAATTRDLQTVLEMRWPRSGELMRRMLRAGASPDLRPSALRLALTQPDLLQTLLQECGASLHHAPYLLREAIEQSHVRAIELLVDAGVRTAADPIETAFEVSEPHSLLTLLRCGVTSADLFASWTANGFTLATGDGDDSLARLATILLAHNLDAALLDRVRAILPDQDSPLAEWLARPGGELRGVLRAVSMLQPERIP